MRRWRNRVNWTFSPARMEDFWVGKMIRVTNCFCVEEFRYNGKSSRFVPFPIWLFGEQTQVSLQLLAS